MNVGVPKERRPFEFRVGLPPAGAAMFARYGHTVYVESGAGEGAGFSDGDYARAGASVAYAPEEAFGRADLVLKFARPLAHELELLPEEVTVAGFLHLAAARQDKIDMILAKKITALAYEQIEEDDGSRPAMAPLSRIGGRMVVQTAASLLQNNNGGRGILLGGHHPGGVLLGPAHAAPPGWAVRRLRLRTSPRSVFRPRASAGMVCRAGSRPRRAMASR